jgi:1,4-alpha-glucan branching enzyme
VLAWLRLGEEDDRPVAIVCNLTPVARHGYRIGLPHAGAWAEILNTDAADYGGSGMGNFGEIVAVAQPSHGFPASAEITIAPLATVYFQYLA